jgi:hypothetical protein
MIGVLLVALYLVGSNLWSLGTKRPAPDKYGIQQAMDEAFTAMPLRTMSSTEIGEVNFGIRRVPTQERPTPTPTMTPSVTPTPSSTVDTWATAYWIAEQTRSAYFTDRGVLPPALKCPDECTPFAPTLEQFPPTATRVWYNTPEPDFTPALLQTRAMDATIQAYIAASATAQAEERSEERFSDERVPDAPRRSPER